MQCVNHGFVENSGLLKFRYAPTLFGNTLF